MSISYPMTSASNQSFIVPMTAGAITISLLWVDNVGWIGGINDVVEGVRITPFLPIFRQYGYENLLFMTDEFEITREGMASAYLVVT